MAVGYAKTSTDMNNILGGVARDFLLLMRRIMDYGVDLAVVQDADLTAMGYSSSDITLIHNYMNDMGTLRNVATGVSTQGTLKDFTANARQIAGLIP